MPKRNRAEYMREYRARKRQRAGPGLDAPVAPSRAAVAEVLAGTQTGPGSEAGGVPAVPERYAATLRFLAGAPMAAADLPRLLVGVALATLAKDCGYSLDSMNLVPAREAPEAP